MFGAATLTVRSPAKLILSGEHSVVYGAPALAMAINRYTKVTAKVIQQPLIKFRSFDLEYTCSHTIQALREIQKKLQHNYSRFLNGQCSIKEVLTMPFELIQFTVTNIVDKLNIQIPKGLHIEIGSKIPMGCGMGSSAAAIVGTLHAILKQVGLDVEHNKFISISKESENLQHGKSSGLDIYVTKNGGTCRFQQGNINSVPNTKHPVFMVNTGVPITSTGECVTHVSKYFDGGNLIDDFTAVTKAVESSLQSHRYEDLIDGIRENNKLLENIGVVPHNISAMISEIEYIGGAGKICGAGAVAGDKAGALLLAGNKQDLTKVVKRHGFQLETFDIDVLGTHVI